MKYSFVFVLCLGALMQCSARPQQPAVDLPTSNVTTTTLAPPDASSAPAEVVETATEVNGTVAGEQVVFDEGEPVVGETTNDENNEAPTTTMPDGSQQDEVTTLPSTCSGDDCNSPVVAQEYAGDVEDDAPASPLEAEDEVDDETEGTTEQSSTSTEDS